MAVTFPVIMLLFVLIMSSVTCDESGDSGDGDLSCDDLVNTTLPPPKIIPGKVDSFKHIHLFLNNKQVMTCGKRD